MLTLLCLGFGFFGHAWWGSERRADRANIGFEEVQLNAEQSGRAYLRIAAEALDCPPRNVLAAYLTTARIGVRHRMETAIGYGIDPSVMALPIASEAELVCELHFDPDLLEAARAAEATDPPEALCPNTE